MTCAMKAIQSPPSCSLLEIFSHRSSLIVFGLFVLAALAQRASGAPLLNVSTPPPTPLAIRLGFGPIEVFISRTNPITSVDSPTGRLRTSGEGAAEGAVPFFGQSSGDLVGDLVTVGLAPIGAVVGAIEARVAKVSPETLAEAREDVTAAMAEMAKPDHLRDSFLKAARESTRRRFSVGESGTDLDHLVVEDPNTVILMLSVEEFRLSRRTSKDTSFALFIRTRARLIRSADGVVMYDQPFDFRSGEGVFIDWTLNHGQPLKNVAETGYRQLAARMVQQLFLNNPESSLLVGSGVRSPKRSPGQAQGMLAAGRSAKDSTRNSVQPIANLGFGGIGIYSTQLFLHVTTPAPVTRDDAMREARDDVDAGLDGLQKCNVLVSIPAMVSKIPYSLYRQTVAGIHGMTAKRASAIETALMNAGDDRILNQELCQGLANELEARTTQRVVLLPGPPSAAKDAGFLQIGSYKLGGLPDWAGSKIAQDYLIREGIGTMMEIQIARALLNGGDQVNAAQCLEVEACVRVLRTGDRLEMHVFPVQYRSRRHSLSDWAAHDARLFRQELDQCSRDLGNAMVDNLVACGIVSPSARGSRDVLARSAVTH